MCAGILTQKNQTAEVDRLHDCRDLLRARTGFFSNFRGIAQEAMITLLFLEPAPQEKLDQGLRLYDALKDHFRPSQYLPLAACFWPTRWKSVSTGRLPPAPGPSATA